MHQACKCMGSLHSSSIFGGIEGLVTRHLAASTGAALVDTLALTDVDGRLVVDGRVTHALLDLASHGQECLFNVGGVLG